MFRYSYVVMVLAAAVALNGCSQCTSSAPDAEEAPAVSAPPPPPADEGMEAPPPPMDEEGMEGGAMEGEEAPPPSET